MVSHFGKEMKPKEIRHCRIIELRNMALGGKKLPELQAKCEGWKLSRPTITSYIKEVRESLQKAMNKHG